MQKQRKIKTAWFLSPKTDNVQKHKTAWQYSSENIKMMWFCRSNYENIKRQALSLKLQEYKKSTSKIELFVQLWGAFQKQKLL